MQSKERQLEVGVPTALMIFDQAPLFRGFFDALNVSYRFSAETNRDTIEKALQKSYTDSCLPVKLLHGHVAQLLEQGVTHILIPNAIRMDHKSGEADQRYACPLVQNAPYLVNSVFDLGSKLLDPVIDFSIGDKEVIKSFTQIGKNLGFGEAESKKAALAGIETQRKFERNAVEAGKQRLAELEADPDRIGVVLLGRAYIAQDEGVNQRLTAKLLEFGVLPVPLAFLPLKSVDISDVSDRPYWNYERKLVAASKLVAKHRQLFGLFLTNFGCGPNSIIQNMVEDIMGGKPLGQIELDEHAAEAGFVTRIEAFVDTIQGYHKAGLHLSASPKEYSRYVPALIRRKGMRVFIPPMADQAYALAAAGRANGVDMQVLPLSDDRSLAMSRDLTNGKECLPFRDTLGVFLRAAKDGDLTSPSAALMAGSYGPCRLGKYALEHQRILDKEGIDLKIMTTVSNNGAYADLGLGQSFEKAAWEGMVATDELLALRRKVRPYEKIAGETQTAYRYYLNEVEKAIESKRPVRPVLCEAVRQISALKDVSLPPRPLVGINGEIYLRSNDFCNRNLESVCEASGLEVAVSPMGEWFEYVTLRNLEDAGKNKDIKRWLKGEIRKLYLEHIKRGVVNCFDETIGKKEADVTDLLRASSPILPSRNGSEAVLSLGSGMLQMKNLHFAGVISVMPHGCMPGGVVAAIAEQISRRSGKKWISLTYDGFNDAVNRERVSDLAEILKHQGFNKRKIRQEQELVLL